MTPQQVINHFGGAEKSVQATADALGLTRQIIYHWQSEGRVPEQRQAWLEKLSGGQLKADQIVVG